MRKPRCIPPVYFLLVVILMVTLDRLWPVVTLVPRPYHLLGLVPLGAGCVLDLWALAWFRKVDTPVKPLEPSTRLVLQGPYRFTRNPMYLGLLCVLLGLWILLGSLTPFAGIVVMYRVLRHRFIAPEERLLEDQFGEAYRDYCRQVRRWL